MTGVSLDQATASVTVGNTVKLSATVLPSTADQHVTWSSSDTSVATVSSGTVTAKSAGKSTITATSKGDSTKTATSEITVTAAE